ncbi:MAG TPA: alpha/beta hydrolase [Gemmataceae bacterium]|jgi:pimeloyl-ACP methyl ester carboxylesterase|nr:alpha/beta hydrolase [Gemmataceae bacterium]
MALPPLDDLSLPGDGVSLHAVRTGDRGGPAVILLHGFPEFWYGWRNQLGPLADAGFHVVALDQRGYNTSDKPPHVRDYNLDRLADDVASVIAALGVDNAAVVGHDWGGIVAWWLAVTRPERVRRLAILNAPHPAVMRRALRTDPLQMLRSWYAFMMQIPGLPEWSFRWRNWDGMVRGLQNSSRPGTFTDNDFVHYRQAWSQPGAITAMINWYRAAMRSPPVIPIDVRVHVPTLLLWGAKDKFIRRKYAEKSAAMCDDARLEVFEDATHWLQHEEAGRVNGRLIEFLRP